MPTKIVSPGVFVEKRNIGVHSFDGVSTSITAFVGYTIDGPTNVPIKLGSIAEFKQTFGAVDASSDVSCALAHFFQNGGTDAWVTRVVGSTDPASPTPAEIIGSEMDKTGMYSMLTVDLFNILLVPGQSDPSVHAAMSDFAKARRAFAVLDLPPDIQTPSAALAWISSSGGAENANAAAYFPRLLAADPTQPTKVRSFANSGAIAGVYARTDQNRGVWEAPAGKEAHVDAVEGLECILTEREVSAVNALGLNPLRNFAGFGNVVWGSRTLVGADNSGSEWKYIPVRRTALFIEESVYRGLQWAIFEPNAEPLWAAVRKSVGAFMLTLFREGAFQGVAEREAFYVLCDSTTMTQDAVNRSILNILIGFAPLKPAEFLTIRLSLQLEV